MNNPSANPFLDDIEAEHHAHLLAFGNLGKKRPNPAQPGADWHDEKAWTSLGYEARVLRTLCNSCGSVRNSLLGIFHREQTPSGATRSQSLDISRPLSIPLDGKFPVITQIVSARLCPDCLSSHGFRFPL